VHGPAEVALDLAGGELVGDRSGVREGSREPVALGDDESLAGAAGGKGLAENGSIASGAGEPVVDVDPAWSTPRSAWASRLAVSSCPAVDTGA
jgi:hypothetical protein